MSRTAVFDALRVEDRARNATVEGSEGPIEALGQLRDFDNHSLAEGRGDQASERAWPRRSLSGALADLGPARPGVTADVEPWTAATSRNENANPPASTATSAASSFDSTTAAQSRPAEEYGDRVGMAGIPPPSRPLRRGPTFEIAEEPRPPVVEDLSNARLAESDKAGAALVKALAAADLARRQQNGGPVAPAAIDMDMLEPAPIIIERAKAEQQLGMVAALPAVPWANPLRGLAIGFSLSLVTGAALYMLLTGG